MEARPILRINAGPAAFFFLQNSGLAAAPLRFWNLELPNSHETEEFRMGFNYAKEKRKFDQEWAALRALYESLGMEQEAIDSLYEFDLQWFRSRRTYENHTQPFPAESYEEGEASSLLRRFPALVAKGADENSSSTFLWDEMTRGLSELDVQILFLRRNKGLKQAEIAKRLGCSQAAVSKRMKKLKKFLI